MGWKYRIIEKTNSDGYSTFYPQYRNTWFPVLDSLCVLPDDRVNFDNIGEADVFIEEQKARDAVYTKVHYR